MNPERRESQELTRMIPFILMVIIRNMQVFHGFTKVPQCFTAYRHLDSRHRVGAHWVNFDFQFTTIIIVWCTDISVPWPTD
jgi:hypothetical protein